VELKLATVIFAVTIAFGSCSLQLGQGFIKTDPDPLKVPSVVSEDNIYIAWSSNKTGNEEVMFRASNDSGKTFSDMINLSNTTNGNSSRVEISAEAGNVVVTWREITLGEEKPVVKISNDFGQTFGPLLELGTNGTIGTGEAKPIL
jgi:hypothetical protein